MSEPQKKDNQGIHSLEALVLQKLYGSNYPAMLKVDCQCSDGVARLSGQVSSFYLKQVAQELVIRTEGIKQVYNLVQVVYDAELT